ncbi:hypothetical protein ACFO25_10225 [Paenactinomyces guangxiensis]|uniref:Uncharacterized protein n=1 Tax=Paenactinomyces guangxiensis TaxID=1490290 RepID=A0A7W1WSR6_9BACL|nr:hypothetical protein [Paenactinomyces guangxiensis]MBA4495161.1 hypothetical protein [Paenactinomyces guangxiensis]MBH8592155.1 hypothetical protein [Paenactinomyces guangxiensis]
MIYIGRLLLGLIFLLAGINGLIVFFGLTPPLPTSPEAMELFRFKYLLFTEKSLEVICGLLLIFNRYTTLAIAMLAPFVVNILLFHLFVDLSMLPLAILVTFLEGYLLWNDRKSFYSLLEREPKDN